jgi:hypothetical protein
MLLTADRPTTSRWTPLIGANAPIRSGRSSTARTEADTSSETHPRRGSQIALEPSLRSAFEPTPAVARADNASEHRDRFQDSQRQFPFVAVAATDPRRLLQARGAATLDSTRDGWRRPAFGFGRASVRRRPTVLECADLGHDADAVLMEQRRADRSALRAARSRCTAGDAEMLVAPSSGSGAPWGLGFRPMSTAVPRGSARVCDGWRRERNERSA